MAGRPITEILDEVRASLQRLVPDDAAALLSGGGLLIDIRPVGLRQQDGEIPGAQIVDRNQLEWRLDPRSSHRLAVVDDATYERPVVLFCDEGFASSLAAASLQAIGLRRATDLDGGFQAWRAAGLPVSEAGQASPASPTAADG